MEPLFFRVKGDFIVVLLSEWLDLNCVGRLDMAMTSKTHRPTWLEALRVMRSPLIDCLEHDRNSLRWMNSRGVQMTKLVFCKSCKGTFAAKFFAELDHILPQLTCINFIKNGQVRIDDGSVALIGQRCSRLATLVFGYCYREPPAILEGLFKNNPELASIKIRHCFPTMLESIATHCSRLEHLDVNVCEDMEPRSKHVLRQIICSQPHLKRLFVTSDGDDSDHFEFEPVLSDILQHCRFLEEFSISGYGKFKTISHQDSPSLGLMRCKKLRIHDCDLVPQDFSYLASNTVLESLDVKTSTVDPDTYLVDLSQGCPALKKLEFYITILDDYASSPYTMGIQALSRAPFCVALESLTIHGCRDVDDQCFVHLSRCSMLHTFVISSPTFRSYTVAGLKALLAGCRLLRYLKLPGGDDDELFAIAAGCPLLERLLVWHLWGVSTAAKHAVFSSCTKLREIDLDVRLTEETIECIARHIPNIETLHVYRGVNSISSTLWTLLATQCPLLRHVPYNEDDSCEEAMKIFARLCPLLESFGEYGKREINAERRRAREIEETLGSLRNVQDLPPQTAEAKLRMALSMIYDRHPELYVSIAGTPK